jgi:hypothetical protein
MVKPIVALSDIHGDIDALVISLRDCAKVIKKKDDFKFTNDKRDENLEQLLNIDIRDKDNGYLEDLNYKWIGNDTNVVIVGDIIDPVKNREIEYHYYPQVEIKIIRFLNALNIKAKEKDGEIIKLIGNHEALNFLNDDTITPFSLKNGTLDSKKNIIAPIRA